MKLKPDKRPILSAVGVVMTFNRSLFSSACGVWETPQDLFDQLSDEFGGFDLDPCASAEKAKCRIYYWHSGLELPWSGKVFMNPPYGREIGKWIKKAYEQSRKGALVVCLPPSRPQ